MTSGEHSSVMEREDVAKLLNGQFARSLSGRANGVAAVIRTTSGTTGGKPIMTVREYRGESLEWFRDSRNIIAAFGSLQVRLTYAVYLRYGPAAVGRMFCTDREDMSACDQRLICDLRLDTCIGWPSIVLKMGQYWQRGIQNVLNVRLTGELITDSAKSLLKKYFPSARIQSQYITAEMGFLSRMSCDLCPNRMYHPHKGVEIEIENPDVEGAGDLLVSKKSIGIERYRVGDVARIVPRRCMCGDPLTFELMGRRGYDFIKVAGVVIVPEEFERVAKLCSDFFKDYRAEVSEFVREDSFVGRIQLYVYEASDASVDAIRYRFTRHLTLSPSHTLGSLVRDGVFLPLEVVVAEGAAEKRLKGAKVRYCKEA